MSTATPAADTHAEQVPGPPPAPAPFQLTVGAWASHAIATAARLGLADARTDGPRSRDDLAVTVGAHSPALHRLLRVLADLGPITASPGCRFALAPLGEPPRSGTDRSLRDWAAIMAAPFYRGPPGNPTIEEPGPSDVTKAAPAEQPPAGHGRARRSAGGSRVDDGGNPKYRVAAGCPARHQRRPAVGDSARVS